MLCLWQVLVSVVIYVYIICVLCVSLYQYFKWKVVVEKCPKTKMCFFVSLLFYDATYLLLLSLPVFDQHSLMCGTLTFPENTFRLEHVKVVVTRQAQRNHQTNEVWGIKMVREVFNKGNLYRRLLGLYRRVQHFGASLSILILV